MKKFRWPKSIHAQIEAVFSSIKAFGTSKADAQAGAIRSIGTWNTYMQEAHSFARFLKNEGVHDLRDVERVAEFASKYFSEKLQDARSVGLSIQTQESRASALSAFERAFNTFFASRFPTVQLDFASTRAEFLAQARVFLVKGANYPGGTRAYADPLVLIAAISNPAHQLQATLQYQGGLRAEGVGAPSGKIANPLTKNNLCGFSKDPVTGVQVGVINVQEKGGKWTKHYLPVKTYKVLSAYIKLHGKLQSRYSEYRASVIQAASQTGQYAKGRGTHGLKTAFAQQRYMECVKHGLSHERAMQATSLELAHNRMDITLVYTRG